MGARLKFWRLSSVPKKGSREEADEIPISRDFAASDGSAVKSYSAILQRLRCQISLDYYPIPPATQANNYIIPVTLLTTCLFRKNLIFTEIMTQTQMNA